MLEGSLKQNVADFHAFKQRQLERHRKNWGSYETGPEEKSEGTREKLNISSCLKAILFSGDSIDTQKAKIARLFEFETQGIEWVYSNKCVIL
jgi:hypothetical protein